MILNPIYIFIGPWPAFARPRYFNVAVMMTENRDASTINDIKAQWSERGLNVGKEEIILSWHDKQMDLCPG